MADETKKRINVYLTADEKEQFADVASEHQRSVSSMARALIVDTIKASRTATATSSVDVVDSGHSSKK